LKLVARRALSIPGARPLVNTEHVDSGQTAPALEEHTLPEPESLSPQQLHTAYALPTNASSPQTIAIVDVYNDLGAEADLSAYDKQFGLPTFPACSTNVTKACFEKVNQNGEVENLPFPASKTEREKEEATCKGRKGTKIGEEACKEVEEADGWAGEIATDVEVAHTVCQNCRIVLVEAKAALFPDLEVAEETAAKSISAGGMGATEISNSWGGPEAGEDSKAFDHAGIVITAAAGDDGYLDWAAENPEERGLPDYPASSPHVVAVGGTRLTLGASGQWTGETVWNDGGTNQKSEPEGYGATGGGCSTLFAAQPWQLEVRDWSSVGCGFKRAVADISADGDPYTGVAVYDSTPFEGSVGWTTIGGTSVASPIVASIFALAGGAHGVAYPAQTLYENLVATPGSLHDVTSGSNGACGNPFNTEPGPNFGTSGCEASVEAQQCSGRTICLAGKGYDGPSGVGTPNGIAAFQPLTEEGKRKAEEQKVKEKAEAEAEAEEEQRHESQGGSSGPSAGGHPSAPIPTAVAPPTGIGPPATAPQSPTKSIFVPILSALTLTRTATAALSHPQPKASQLAFAFTSSTRARVRVTLAKLIRVRGHMRWQTLPYTLTITAAKGRDSAHLSAHTHLAPGRYRLTLTPLHGKARTLTFQVG
jgi:hypothetical protein